VEDLGRLNRASAAHPAAFAASRSALA
jgi:hypothetical protein